MSRCVYARASDIYILSKQDFGFAFTIGRNAKLQSPTNGISQGSAELIHNGCQSRQPRRHLEPWSKSLLSALQIFSF
jgi:hypothetical protein